MMIAGGEECDSSKKPVEIPRYGTFAQAAVPPVAPLRGSPHLYQQQPKLPPAQLPAYQVIPVGYQSIPYAVVAEGIPIREHRLPCGGIGIGWVLFLSGFLLATVPWYIGALLFLVGALDHREKPGLVACTVAVSIELIFQEEFYFSNYISNIICKTLEWLFSASCFQ
ncbi:60S ribosomal protein L18a-1 [Dendrobium catenatum]|uniref:60S ribosomal protein L18a-1 n=1 Tax=Dendrobium catenatum TaxID=906689 RepID=A0A2I0X5K9_9ASPA|nr:60S ribosomal protein L18a-1 [Dendrobium catenatum]